MWTAPHLQKYLYSSLKRCMSLYLFRNYYTGEFKKVKSEVSLLPNYIPNTRISTEESRTCMWSVYQYIQYDTKHRIGCKVNQSGKTETHKTQHNGVGDPGKGEDRASRRIVQWEEGRVLRPCSNLPSSCWPPQCFWPPLWTVATWNAGGGGGGVMSPFATNLDTTLNGGDPLFTLYVI